MDEVDGTESATEILVTRLVSAFPRELQERPQWVAWMAVPREEGKISKLPICPRTGQAASSTDPSTWGTLQAACARLAMGRPLTGLGFVLSARMCLDRLLVGVDLDKCAIDGKLAPWAMRIIEQVQSYAEISPSGTGAHILAWASPGWKPAWNRKGQVEIYTDARYLCSTGAIFDARFAELREAQDALDAVILELSAGNPSNGHVRLFSTAGMQASASSAQGEDIALAAFPADAFQALMTNHRTFAATWAHKRPDLADQSASCYDLALATIAAIAQWTDAEIAALLFQHRVMYGQNPEKARRQDYLRRTVNAAKAVASQHHAELEAKEELSQIRHADAEERRRSARADQVLKDAAEQAVISPDEARAALKERLGLDIIKLRQIGDPGVQYQLHLHYGQEILQVDLGGAATLVTPRSFQVALLAHSAVAISIPAMKAAAWMAGLKMFAALTEVVHGTEIELHERVAALIDDARQNAITWEDETPAYRHSILVGRRPVMWGGRIHVFPATVLLALVGEGSKDVDSSRLRMAFMRLNGAPHVLSVRSERGKTASARYWSFPETGEAHESGTSL